MNVDVAVFVGMHLLDRFTTNKSGAGAVIVKGWAQLASPDNGRACARACPVIWC